MPSRHAKNRGTTRCTLILTNLLPISDPFLSNREQGLARRDGLHLARPSTAPVQLFGSYPNFDESEDYGDIVTEADRTRIKQDLDMHYRLRRDHMFKQMQLGFRQKQQELLRGMPKNKKKKRKDKQKRKDKGSDNTGLRAWRESYDDSESEESDNEEESEESEDEWKRSFTSPWDRNADFEELRKARAKVDVVVCTTDFGTRCTARKPNTINTCLFYHGSPRLSHRGEIGRLQGCRTENVGFQAMDQRSLILMTISMLATTVSCRLTSHLKKWRMLFRWLKWFDKK